MVRGASAAPTGNTVSPAAGAGAPAADADELVCQSDTPSGNVRCDVGLAAQFPQQIAVEHG